MKELQASILAKQMHSRRLKLEKLRCRNQVHEYEVLFELSGTFGLDRRMLKELRSQIYEHPELDILESLKSGDYGMLPQYLYIEHVPVHSVQLWQGPRIRETPAWAQLADRLKEHGDIILVFPVHRLPDHVITSLGFETHGMTTGVTLDFGDPEGAARERRMTIMELNTFKEYQP